MTTPLLDGQAVCASLSLYTIFFLFGISQDSKTLHIRIYFVGTLTVFYVPSYRDGADDNVISRHELCKTNSVEIFS